MRIGEVREGNAPIGHAAGGIGLGDLLEYLFRLRVPERVLVAHAAVEAALCDLVTGGGEMHSPETLVDILLRESGLREGHAERKGDGKCSQ